MGLMWNKNKKGRRGKEVHAFVMRRKRGGGAYSWLRVAAPQGRRTKRNSPEEGGISEKEGLVKLNIHRQKPEGGGQSTMRSRKQASEGRGEKTCSTKRADREKRINKLKTWRKKDPSEGA